MSSRTARKQETRRARVEAEVAARHAKRSRELGVRMAVVLGVAVAALAAVFVLSNSGGAGGRAAGGSSPSSAAYPYAVGEPGPGAVAPPIRLASTAGGTFDLGAQKGKTVLLYFQEGVGCQPCWDQIKDLEKDPTRLAALGIDEMVSITGNDLGQLRQKIADEGIKTPQLADPGLRASKGYRANEYGMMGTSADGHSFVVVGPDGRIAYRADYGGAPKYTMYVPVDVLIAQIRHGLRARS